MKFIQYCLIFLLFFSCSCQNKQKENSNTGTLTVGVMSSMDYVPIAVAKKMNLFNENEINISIEKFYSANDRDAAFQSGNIDGTVIDYTGALLQKAGGIQLKLTSACNAPFVIVSSPDSKANSMQDLKNKKISVSRNTVIDFCIDMALVSSDMNETDIEKVEINKIPLRYEMLLKNEIQATALPDPFLTIALNNQCNRIISIKDLGFQVTGIMFSQNAIDNKSKEIKAFYEGYNKGVDYILTHSIEELKEILISEIGFPGELISAVNLPDYTHARIPSDSDIKKTSDWLKRKKLIPENFNTSNVLDNQFITK